MQKLLLKRSATGKLSYAKSVAKAFQPLYGALL